MVIYCISENLKGQGICYLVYHQELLNIIFFSFWGLRIKNLIKPVIHCNKTNSLKGAFCESEFKSSEAVGFSKRNLLYSLQGGAGGQPRDLSGSPVVFYTGRSWGSAPRPVRLTCASWIRRNGSGMSIAVISFPVMEVYYQNGPMK